MSSVGGVEPFFIPLESTLSRCSSQRSGTSPSHSTPEGVVGRVGLAGADVDPARDGLVDDGLLLLLQQRDQLLLGADVAPDAPVGVIEEADDSGLFGKRWEGCARMALIAGASFIEQAAMAMTAGIDVVVGRCVSTPMMAFHARSKRAAFDQVRKVAQPVRRRSSACRSASCLGHQDVLLAASTTPEPMATPSANQIGSACAGGACGRRRVPVRSRPDPALRYHEGGASPGSPCRRHRGRERRTSRYLSNQSEDRMVGCRSDVRRHAAKSMTSVGDRVSRKVQLSAVGIANPDVGAQLPDMCDFACTAAPISYLVPLSGMRPR